MNDVLQTPRTIVIGGHARTFSSYIELADLAGQLIVSTQRLEASMPADVLTSRQQWTEIRKLLDMVAEVGAAQMSWLDDADLSIADAIEAARRDIRNLNSSAGMEDVKD